MNPPMLMHSFRRTLRATGWILSWIILGGLTLWSVGAVYYSNLPALWMRSAGAAAFGLGTIILFVRVRPWWRTWLVFLAAFAGVAAWFFLIPPGNDRDWQPDVAVLPYADIN